MRYCYQCFTKIEDEKVRFCPNCGNEIDGYFAQSFELPAGTYLNNGRYLVGQSLGAGGFGITYLGLDTKLKRRIVVKETFYNGFFKRNCYNTNIASPLSVTYDSTISLDDIMRKTEKECLSLSKAENIKNIVKVYDWFSENNTAYIITEYINGETLYDRIINHGKYNWNDFYQKIRPLMISLSILHKNELIHRDIKPHNIMINNNGYEEEFILIDFGLARSSDVQTLSTGGVSFTPGFAPFEQRSFTYPDGTYTDVYSLAATIYFALAGEIPLNIQSPDIDETFPKMQELESTGAIPGNVAEALRSALNQNFRVRCQTINEFLDKLDNKSPAQNNAQFNKTDSTANSHFNTNNGTIKIPTQNDNTVNVQTANNFPATTYANTPPSNNNIPANTSSINYVTPYKKNNKPLIISACAAVLVLGIVGGVVAKSIGSGSSGSSAPSKDYSSRQTSSASIFSSEESSQSDISSASVSSEESSQSSTLSSSSAGSFQEATGGKVYYLNFKPEQADAWVELAKIYTEQTGVEVTVETAASGTYESKLKAEMAKDNAPTLFQVNGPAELASWTDYCYDLKDTDLYSYLKSDDFALIEDDEVKGIDYVIETYGIIYNKTLLDEYFKTNKPVVTSVDKINNFDTFKAVVEDIQSKKDDLGIMGAFTSSGMDSSSDWRFKTHLANLPIYYEYKADGISSTDAIKGTYLDNYKAIWDLYINNATCTPKMISGKTGDDASAEFCSGEAVFYQNGTWAYADCIDNGMTDDELGMLPIYIGADGEENQGLCTGSENYWCVNSKASQDDINATIDFLNWVVSCDEGRNALSNYMGFVTPFTTFDDGYQLDNALISAANEYVDDGKTSVTWTFDTIPSEKWKDDVGTALTEYAQGTADWSAVETAFVDGWKTEYAANN